MLTRTDRRPNQSVKWRLILHHFMMTVSCGYPNAYNIAEFIGMYAKKVMQSFSNLLVNGRSGIETLGQEPRGGRPRENCLDQRSRRSSLPSSDRLSPDEPAASS